MRRVGVGTGYAVGGKTQVQLELAQRKLGVGAEDAVGAPARESQSTQRLLQLTHVVAVKVRHAQVQRTIAQR